MEKLQRKNGNRFINLSVDFAGERVREAHFACGSPAQIRRMQLAASGERVRVALASPRMANERRGAGGVK